MEMTDFYACEKVRIIVKDSFPGRMKINVYHEIPTFHKVIGQGR